MKFYNALFATILILSSVSASSAFEGVTEESSSRAEKFFPYFVGGGVIGNGSEPLSLTEERAFHEGEELIEIPDSLEDFSIHLEDENN